MVLMLSGSIPSGYQYPPVQRISRYCSRNNKLFEELSALVHSRAQVDSIIRSESSSVAFFVYLVSFESLRCRLRHRNGNKTRIKLNKLEMFTLCRWPGDCLAGATNVPMSRPRHGAEPSLWYVESGSDWVRGKSNGQLSAGIWRERERSIQSIDTRQ